MILLIIILPLIGSLLFLPISFYKNNTNIEDNINKNINFYNILNNQNEIYNQQLKQNSLFSLHSQSDTFYNNKISNNTTIFNKKFSIIKQIGLSTSLLTLTLSIILFIQFNGAVNYFQNPDINLNSINYNIFNYNLSVDSISIYYLLLTTFITPICILCNWNDISNKIQYYIFSFLLLETLQLSFFLVTDLLLFYIYFESVLIPLFMIIGIWGASKARIRAAFLLFLYTLGGSLPMLLAILWINHNLGTTDLNYLNLLDLNNISIEIQGWIWLAFFLAFAVKSPTYPFHLWLFRAHVESPLAGSVLLAAVILKLATYGFLRILLGLLPEYTANNHFIIQSLAIITLIYSSLVTCRQTDLKSLVAYSSVSHVAIMILGLFSNTIQGIEGGILLSLAHGLVSPALFIIVGGILYTRYHTRLINYYRGMTVTMPILSIIFFLFIIFNASAPLSLNFIGEFLVLTGIFSNSPIVGILASTGIIFSAIYSIFLYNRIAFLGFSPYIKPKQMIIYQHSKSNVQLNNNVYNTITNPGIEKININYLNDLNRLELSLILPLLFVTILFGIFPDVILDSLHYQVTNLLYYIN